MNVHEVRKEAKGGCQSVDLIRDRSGWISPGGVARGTKGKKGHKKIEKEWKVTDMKEKERVREKERNEREEMAFRVYTILSFLPSALAKIASSRVISHWAI